MASRQEVLTYVLSKLQANFDLPMTKTDPAYAEMVREFEEHLMPFDLWELKDGVFEFVHNAKSRKWPAVGAVVAVCQDMAQNRLPPDQRNQTRIAPPAKPERLPMSERDRTRIGYQLEVLREYQANGRWKTLAECKAEALRRMDADEARQSGFLKRA